MGSAGYRSLGSVAGNQVSGDLLSGHHSASTRVCQSFPQFAHQLGIGQHLDRLAQPVRFPGWHDVGPVVTMCYHRH